MSEKEYEPFGEEWKKEIMKMKKSYIVDMLKEVCNNRELVYRSMTSCFPNYPQGGDFVAPADYSVDEWINKLS